MMTTRSRATWDEVKTNPFLQQVRPARWPAAFWFHALYGGRGCATTAARGGGANGRGRSRRPGETSVLVLRAAGTSPFVRKVRIVSSVLALDDRIEISAADTGNPEDSLRRQNPLGKIPTLILEDGETIFDSAVIVEYLDWLAGSGKVIPSEPQARFRTLTQQAMADGIAEAAVLIRYERLWHEPPQRSEQWIAYQNEKIARALGVFEGRPPEELSDAGTIALASALGYLDLRYEGAWRADHPRLVDWLDVFSDATPSFEATRVQG